MKTFNGDDINHASSFQSLQNNLIDLVAETSIWAKPEKVTLTPAYPDVRRGAPREKGDVIDGIRMDDNTYANLALKRAISKTSDFKNYMVCHIWPGTTYDERYHTLVANLVLIPRVIAGLSDFCPAVIDCLKYRAFELYGWYPEGEDEPLRPGYYPEKWGDYVSDDTEVTDDVPSLEEELERMQQEEEETRNDEIAKVIRKVPKWIRRPYQINSRLLSLYMEMSDNDRVAVKRDDLQAAFEQDSSDPFYSNYVQMKNFGPKNHGKVFEENRMGFIRLWRPVADFIKRAFTGKK